MHVGRLLGIVWVPCAAAAGPVISQRHGMPQILGGVVAFTAPLVAAWVCHRLDDRRAGLPAYAVVRAGPAPYVGFAVGLLLMLSAYGNVDRLYAQHFMYRSEVVVMGSGCAKLISGCTEYATLATTDGRRLPLELYDVAGGRRAGEKIMVRWDRLGYASPLPTTYPGTNAPMSRDSALVPPWLVPLPVLLYVAVVLYYAAQGRKRRRAADVLSRQARIAHRRARPTVPLDRLRLRARPDQVRTGAPPPRVRPRHRP
jgi:hypothetical protein